MQIDRQSGKIQDNNSVVAIEELISFGDSTNSRTKNNNTITGNGYLDIDYIKHFEILNFKNNIQPSL